jgi:hypothetical protein
MQITVNSEHGLQQAIGDMRDLYKQHRFVRVKLTTGKARSLDQNGISHVWYEQVARELREDTPLMVKCFCKLHYGVPIMRAEDEEFRTLYDSVIKPLSYEKKLEAMKVWPVTSLMNKDQLSQYLTAMQAGYAGMVRLEFPNEEGMAA